MYCLTLLTTATQWISEPCKIIVFTAVGLYEDCDPVSVGKFPLTWLNPKSVKQAAKKTGLFLETVMPDVFLLWAKVYN